MTPPEREPDGGPDDGATDDASTDDPSAHDASPDDAGTNDASTDDAGTDDAGTVDGQGLVRLDVAATLVFAVVSAAAAVAPDPLQYVSVPVDLALFAVGCGAFLWAYAVAIGRSRYEVVSMAGVFFLADGVAPARVARTLRLALAAQVVVAVAVAAVRPFTALAFSVLVPMLGLGLMALWGARHGHFPRKAVEDAVVRPRG